MATTEQHDVGSEFTLADVDPGKGREVYPLISEGALAAILSSLGTAPSFRDCMRQCALTLHQWTHADGASVFRLVGGGEELEQVHSVGFPRAVAEMTQQMSLNKSFTGSAAREKRLILCRNPATDQRVPVVYRQLLVDEGFQTLVAIPLMMHAEVVGAISLGWRERVNLSERDCDMLMHIGFGIAIAVDHDLREFESTRDGLTGLYNRREFDARMPQLLQICRQSGTPLSLAVLDLDDFKYCNDRHGHLLGDEILKAAAKLMQAHMLMQSGDVFRIGGEEFVLLLPRQSAADCGSLVEGICADFAAESFTGRNGQPFGVTMSAGIAEYDQTSMETPRDLFGRADQAMYQAKESGKNRVMIATTAAGAGDG